MFFDHAFTGRIATHSVGEKYRFVVLWLPDDTATLLPLERHPRLRVSGEIADLPFEAAWNPAGVRWFMIVPKPILREASLSPGDVVDVRFSIGDQDAVELPEILADALDADAALSALWEAQTSGRRRGMAWYVSQAKRQATQAARLAEVLAATETGGRWPPRGRG